MNKTSKNETGFSVVDLLLVLVTLAVIGVAGYLVAKHVDNKNAAAGTNSSTKLSTGKSATNTKQSAQAYLDIKELGIKFPIPKSVNDLTYTWGTDVSNVATLHSQAWLQYTQANDPTCAAEDSKISSPPSDWAGYISEATGSTTGTVNAVTVNGKTYAFEGHQQGCNTSDPGNPTAVNQKEVANDQAIDAALKQAVAD